MRRRSTALVRAEKAASSARRRLAKYKTSNPNLMTVGSVALGGALPALIVEPMEQIPDSIATIPTEGLIGAGLLLVAHRSKGNTKKALEGVAEGMIAVTAYKLTKTYTAGGSQ
jgi:hypothetical protein